MQLTKVVSSCRDRAALGGFNVRLVDHIVRLVGLGSATVGGDIAGRGAFQHSDVAAVKPGASALAEDEVAGQIGWLVYMYLIGDGA